MSRNEQSSLSQQNSNCTIELLNTEEISVANVRSIYWLKKKYRAIRKFLQWGWPDQVLLTRCWNGVITPLNSFWRRRTTISNIFLRSAKGFEVLFRAHLLKWIELLRILLQKIHQTPMGRRWPVEALQICVRRSARLGCPKGVGVGPSLEGMGGPLGWWMFC